MPTDVTTKEGREQCWDARDKYWKCLDENDNDKEKCKEARKPFEELCSKTWIKYFDRRKDYLKFRSAIDSGKKDYIDEFLKDSKNKKSPE